MTLISNTQPIIASTGSSSVPSTASSLVGSPASSPLSPHDLVIEMGPAVAELNSDVFVPPTTSPQPPNPQPQNPIRETQESNKKAYTLGYKIKQYGSNALIIGGATLAFALMIAPEPFVTKLVAGLIALACILGGVIAKHQLYKNACLTGEINHVVDKLGTRVNVLHQEVTQLDSTRQKLEETNQDLKQTKNEFNHEVSNLTTQVDRLKVEVSEAYDALNEDRRSFENERSAKIAQLHNEIRDADARGDEADRRLTELDTREKDLMEYGAELEERRHKLLTAESKLQGMQAMLLRRLDCQHPQS